MAANKKFFDYKIYVPEELNKKGFVSWNDPKKGRQRKYGDINSYATYEERLAAAEELKKKLSKGKKNNIAVKLALEFCTKQKSIWRPKTYTTVNSKVKIFGQWLDGRKPTRDLMEEFLLHICNIRAKTTAESYRVKLQHVFKEIGYGHLFEDIKRIKHSSTPAKYFQKYQLKKIKKYLLDRDQDFWFAAQILYYCFIRPGDEMHHLRVSDVNFDSWQICIRNRYAKNGLQEFVTIPVAFREEIFERLKDLPPRRLIFPSSRDISKPRAVNYFSYKWRIYAKDMGFGLEHKFYSFKHTGAVCCALAGVSIKELQIQLRHKDLDTTDKYLRQLGVQDLQRLAEKFPPI